METTVSLNALENSNRIIISKTVDSNNFKLFIKILHHWLKMIVILDLMKWFYCKVTDWLTKANN